MYVYINIIQFFFVFGFETAMSIKEEYKYLLTQFQNQRKTTQLQNCGSHTVSLISRRFGQSIYE